MTSSVATIYCLAGSFKKKAIYYSIITFLQVSINKSIIFALVNVLCVIYVYSIIHQQYEPRQSTDNSPYNEETLVENKISRGSPIKSTTAHVREHMTALGERAEVGARLQLSLFDAKTGG